MRFYPQRPRRLLEAPIYERAQWHYEQAERHAERVVGLDIRGRKSDLREAERHKLAHDFHNEMGDYWEGMQEAMDEARTEYGTQQRIPNHPQTTTEKTRSKQR